MLSGSPVRNRGRAFSSVGVILTLLWPGTLQAGPVAINEVIQVISSHQNAPDLRLRALTQIGNTAISISPAVNAGIANKQGANAKPATTYSLFSGADFQTDQKPTTVVVLSQSDVEGTICDCGEILLAGGGFPKWPLLFLAAIPFFFIDGDDTPPFIPSPVPTPPSASPTPTIPPAAIPEPGSLMLFGSGLLALGAAFRRRKAKIKAATPTEGT